MFGTALKAIVRVVAGRETEVSLARQLGEQDTADAAESSIVGMLTVLGRALLVQQENDGGGRRGNLPWAFTGLIAGLLASGRADEARALIGYARAGFQARGIELGRQEKERFADQWMQVLQVLGPAAAESSEARGRSLDDGAAEALAVGEAVRPAATPPPAVCTSAVSAVDAVLSEHVAHEDRRGNRAIG